MNRDQYQKSDPLGLYYVLTLTPTCTNYLGIDHDSLNGSLLHIPYTYMTTISLSSEQQELLLTHGSDIRAKGYALDQGSKNRYRAKSRLGPGNGSRLVTGKTGRNS